MLQKLSFWFVGGLSAGLALSLPLWLMLMPAFNMYVANKDNVEQTIATSLIESSIKNPEVQNILKTQILLYLRSPEGRIKLAETLKSPEMTKAMSENIQSPEVQSAILKLLANPEFSQGILQIIKDTPEGKLLTTLAGAITFDNQQTSNDSRGNKEKY